MSHARRANPSAQLQSARQVAAQNLSLCALRAQRRADAIAGYATGGPAFAMAAAASSQSGPGAGPSTSHVAPACA